jgi:hypothetical protein
MFELDADTEAPRVLKDKKPIRLEDLNDTEKLQVFKLLLDEIADYERRIDDAYYDALDRDERD